MFHFFVTELASHDSSSTESRVSQSLSGSTWNRIGHLQALELTGHPSVALCATNSDKNL